MIYTLLECTKLILSAMDSDEVDSITDTTESRDIALLLKSVFYDCATELGLPQQERLLELTETSTSTPVIMTVPTGVVALKNIRYDNRLSTDTTSDYQLVEYMPFQQFLEMMTSVRQDTTGVAQLTYTQSGETFEMMYFTDRAPRYYTTTNDNQLIFDAFDSSVDTFLRKSKTMCQAWSYPTWTESDSFVPPLEPAQFSFYINKAKARAFNEKKQVDNKEAISEARRQKISLQKKKQTVAGMTPLQRRPHYGRK